MIFTAEMNQSKTYLRWTMTLF